MKWIIFRSPLFRAFYAPLMAACLTLLHWLIVKYHAPLEVDILVSCLVAGVFAFGAMHRPWYFLAIAVLLEIIFLGGRNRAHHLFGSCLFLGWALGTACGLIRRLFNMNIDRESQTNQRWLIVTLLAWGLISALLFARNWQLWGLKEVYFNITMSLFSASIPTLIFVSLPFRVLQNLTQPERRRSRLRETVMCIVTFLALVNLVYLVIVSYPPDW